MVRPEDFKVFVNQVGLLCQCQAHAINSVISQNKADSKNFKA